MSGTLLDDVRTFCCYIQGVLKNNWKYGAGKLGFPHAKEFAPKLCSTGHGPSEISASSALRRKRLKYVGSKGRLASWAGSGCVP